MFATKRLARLACILSLAILALLGATLDAQAASAAPRRPHRPQSTIHVGECAIGTPTLASMYVGTTDYLFVAWVGCDSQHHLNVEGSTDGMNWGNCGTNNWICTKHTLSYLSLIDAGPALANWNGNLYVGWTGTDHHLNIGWYNWASALIQPTRLSDTSNFGPALAAHLTSGSYKLYIVWTGDDAGRHLNYEYTTNGTSFTGKVTGTDTASGAPGLADWSSSPAGWQLYVAWMARNSVGSLCIGYIRQGYTTLGNHNCNIKDCLSNPCSPAYALGDVGLSSNGSKLYAGYYGNGDLNGGYCTSCDAFRVADTYDGTNFGFHNDNSAVTTFVTYGSSVAYQTSSGGVFQGWTMEGICAGGGADCWMIGLVPG